MRYLNIDEETLIGRGAIHTAKEISGQPELWDSIYRKVLSKNKELELFMREVLGNVQRVILTGAGSSAFIGCSLEGVFQRKSKICTDAIPTTHLVSHPEDYFEYSVPTLLVSFARSGNSPESIAVVKLADRYCQKCYHLVISCNPDGSLASYDYKKGNYVFILPSEADDKSLAMTGSYTGMMLTALLINDIGNIAALGASIEALKLYGNKLLSNYSKQIEMVAAMPFSRCVFLGSGPQYGTALESHLKLQELSDGQIICKNDSYLGFRHGPKAIVNEHTLMVYYFSNKEEVLRYELDLVNGMDKGKKPLYQIGITERYLEGVTLNEQLVLSDGTLSVDEEFLPISNILLGQILGFYKSLDLGLKPDNPSQSGAISRVVEGVTIYQMK